MALGTNVIVLSGLSGYDLSQYVPPYDGLIIGDSTAGGNCGWYLPSQTGLTTGYKFFISDPYGYINKNGFALYPQPIDSGFTTYVNGINLSLSPSPFNGAQFFQTPYQTYEVVFEGKSNSSLYYSVKNYKELKTSFLLNYSTISGFWNGTNNTATGHTISITANGVTPTGATPASITDTNTYLPIPLGAYLNISQKENIFIFDLDIHRDAINMNGVNHILLNLPNLTENNQTAGDYSAYSTLGFTIKILVKNATLSTDNSVFLMVSSLPNTKPQEFLNSGIYAPSAITPRIIASNAKTYFNGYYFLQLTSGESVELTWDGSDWFVTNLNKQTFMHFNAKSFIHLNKNNPKYFDPTYLETNPDRLTYDIDDLRANSFTT